MIYGLNFNNTPIPDHIRRKFAQKKRMMLGYVHLQGVCNTALESEDMLCVASNGRRRVAAIGPRKIGKEIWYGVYAGR
jgi:hypothetical protein